MSGEFPLGNFTDLDNQEGLPPNYDVGTGAPTPAAKVMPLIAGTSREVSGGTGIQIAVDNAEVRNFEVTNLNSGVYVSENKKNNKIANIYCHDVNSDSIAHQGAGIWLGKNADDNEVTNCVILNAANIAFQTTGSDNLFSGCKAWADDNSTSVSATDYYFLINAGRDNEQVFTVNRNRIEHCYAELFTDNGVPLDHSGHGFVVQGELMYPYVPLHVAEFNSIGNCTSKNMAEPFILRGGGARDNTFYDCTSTGNYQDPKADGCITISGGPVRNKFLRVNLIKSQVGISFFGDGLFQRGSIVAGKDNSFEECQIQVRDIAINLHIYSNFGLFDKHVVNNDWKTCTFFGDDPNAIFFQADRISDDNELDTCIVTGFETYISGRGADPNKPEFVPDFDVGTTTFTNNGPNFP